MLSAKHRLLDRLDTRFRARLMSSALTLWHAHATAARVHEQQTRAMSQRAQLIRRVITQWRHGTVAPVLRAWRVYAHVQRAKRRHILDRVMRRIEHGDVAKAWRT